jgi:cystathionine beta-lyase/cystathionine gamma-synthase
VSDRADLDLSTLGVHGGAPEPEPGAPVVPPVVQSATFFGGTGEPSSRLLYSRYGNNPNQALIARKIAALEGTESSLLLSSGMAAIALTILSVTDAGDHLVASKFLYGTTKTLLSEELPRRGVDVSFVDPSDPGAWRDAVTPRTRALLLEVPTNPTLRFFDPRVPAALAEELGALLIVDGTFASPVNVRFAELGVGAVVHSATKFLGGHSDLIAGVVSGSESVVSKVQALMKLYGPAPDPHMAWLLDRGLRTLTLRVSRQNETALALARWFEQRDEVEVVHYPGLEAHPDHALATELMQGFGGMLSMVVRGGAPAADAFSEALRLALVAPSLGGVETLVSQPRHTSHIHQSPEERLDLGIPDGFLRLSIGVEGLQDLKDDFSAGLQAASGTH